MGLPNNKPRTNTITSYITADLGYCCPWSFFKLYPGGKWTALVADRLGVTPRAVRYCRDSATRCTETAGCKRKTIYKIIAAEPNKPWPK